MKDRLCLMDLASPVRSAYFFLLFFSVTISIDP